MTYPPFDTKLETNYNYMLVFLPVHEMKIINTTIDIKPLAVIIFIHAHCQVMSCAPLYYVQQPYSFLIQLVSCY